MIYMLRGRNAAVDGESHVKAMQERERKDFHHEFTTMRFLALKEFGTWNVKSAYTELT